MAATTKEKVGVFFIAGIMALSVVGGSLLFVVQQRNNDKEQERQQEQQEAFERQQTRQLNCSLAAQEHKNQNLNAPQINKAEGDINELETEDIKEGSGETVEAGDCIVINYHGYTAKQGNVFDSSFDRDNPLSIFIGVGTVIEGWDRGVLGMKVGGTRRLTIPYSLAYGEAGGTRNPTTGDLLSDKSDPAKEIDPTAEVDSDDDGKIDYIPEKTDLIFEVELVDLIKASSQELDKENQ